MLLTGEVVTCSAASLKSSFQFQPNVLIPMHVSIVSPSLFPSKNNHLGSFHEGALSSSARCRLTVGCSSRLQEGSWGTPAELAPVLAAALHLVGPLHLDASNVSLIGLNLMGFQCFHFLK